MTRARPGRSRVALLALALVGCGTPDGACPAADLAPLDEPPAYAVVNTDYASTAIALLDADGELLREAWLDSGTVPPSIVAGLGGDVVLSSAPLDACVLTLVDRFRADVLTFLDVCTDDPGAVVIGQVDVARDGATSNPHDVVAIGDGRALVSRHAPEANDLLVVDWRAGAVGERIPLGSLDVEVTVEDAAGAPEVVRAYARPSRMVRLRAGGTARVVVGLARMDRSFMTTGPGAVAVVDADTGAVEAVPLEGLEACDEVDAVPGHPALAAVSCGGRAFTGEEGRRAAAGVAILELRPDGVVRVRERWRAADHPVQPVFNTWTVPLGPERVVATAMGDFSLGLDDRVGVLSMDDADPTPLLMEAGDAFVIGDGAFDPDRGLLLLPDADAGVVRRFEVTADGSFLERDPVDTAGCRGLPPREVRALARPE